MLLSTLPVTGITGEASGDRDCLAGQGWLVRILPPASVSIPCFDRIPEAQVRELEHTGAVVRSNGQHTYLDRLECLARSSATGARRLRPWLARKVLCSPARQWLLRVGVRGTDVLHSLYTARGSVGRFPRVGTIHDMIYLKMPGYPPAAVERFRQTIDFFRSNT